MRRVFILALALSATACATTSRAASLASQLKSFDAYAAETMPKEQRPALTIGVLRGDEMWTRAYGYADLENMTPVRVDSSFRIASTQKPMTATAVLQLVEAGKLDLDGEIQQYVPRYPKKPFPIKIRQLLGHIGGMPHYVNRAVESHYVTHKTTEETIDIFKGYDLVAEPGTKWSYSTYGYDLLAAAVEGVSGQPFGDYMRDHVWRPAGMNDTRMDDPYELIPRRVRGYRLIDGRLRNSEFVDISSRFGGGGTRSTVVDLLRFAQAYFGGKLVKPEHVALATTSMETRDGKATNYGMGWNVAKFSGHLAYFHDGGQPETRTFLIHFPNERLTFALCTNLEADNYSPYLDRLMQLLLGGKFEMDK